MNELAIIIEYFKSKGSGFIYQGQSYSIFGEESSTHTMRTCGQPTAWKMPKMQMSEAEKMEKLAIIIEYFKSEGSGFIYQGQSYSIFGEESSTHTMCTYGQPTAWKMPSVGNAAFYSISDKQLELAIAQGQAPWCFICRKPTSVREVACSSCVASLLP